jgi:hypothetical protein
MATTLEDIRSFLSATAYREAHPRRSAGAACRPFVTISRQAGAGARAVGMKGGGMP